MALTRWPRRPSGSRRHGRRRSARWMTAVRAFSAVRRGSRKAGKHDPLRSLGMASSIRPTRVSPRERRSRPLPVAVAVVDAVRAAHPGGSAGELVDLGRHQPLAGERQQLTDQIGIGALLDQLEQRHSLVGHRRLRFGSRLATRTSTEDRRWPPCATGRPLRYAEASPRGLPKEVLRRQRPARCPSRNARRICRR